MNDYDEKLRRNAMRAADIVHDYLTDKRPGGDDIKVSIAAITQFNKHRATRGADNLLKFAVCRSIAETQDDLKKLIVDNIPEVNPVKQLV